MNSSVEHLWPATDADPSGQIRRTPDPSTKDREIADLKASIDELNLSLDKANRRVNRLLGEKSQLSAQLEKRDDQVERLNRDLGKYLSTQSRVEPGTAGTSEPKNPLSSTVSSMIDWAGSFFAQRRKVTEEIAANIPNLDSDTKARARRPHLIARHGGKAEYRVVGVLLLGLDKVEIERLLPIVERDCSSRGVKPLCLVDIDAFELLRGRGLIFEYLPPAEERDRFDASLHWNLYLQRRLAIIRKKWDPVRIVAFGESATETLSLWSVSPFEDAPLPAVFREPPKTERQVAL